ncbi:hypothetical protein AOC05_00350 [Arthrobacter alpinus]|uniref:ParB/Sulfiredoxin domain-containing protein n=1 Tax=Arthrobacter alpinus TaxID=656366 RepID=A0A0M5LWV3_9MICC|nr:hypothetical protein [Arthrobacter alpinus]ALE91174.1 hypothetical protein AOC05_00350 [Arthrobacter alpinus]
MTKADEVSPRTIRSNVSVHGLLLDPENPRLASPEYDQTKIVKILYFQESLEELALSFQRNGYFEEEPLVTIDGSDDTLIVVEGNRRLATLKLLLSPELLLEIGGDSSNWPELTEEQRLRLEVVPTVKYRNRESVAPYLGFRHITGARTWKPLQKARFVAKLVEDGRTVDEVQELIGDPTATAAKRMYQSYVLYRQVETDLPQIEIQTLAENFSLIETMLGNTSIKKHLGISLALPTASVSNLVEPDNLANLEEMLVWIYGDGYETPPVIGESREIKKKLGAVVASERALQWLRNTDDLESAYKIATPGHELLATKIAKIGSQLSELLPDITSAHLDETVHEEIAKLARVINVLIGASKTGSNLDSTQVDS